MKRLARKPSRRPPETDRKRRKLAVPKTEIAAGNRALARGDWQVARRCFERALRRGETPEALEGLGMAAWWLDDAATIFDARERAYRLYRQHKDRRGAGRVAMTLAGDYLKFRGEVAVTSGWYRRAHRLLDGLTPIPEQGWLKLWEGDFAMNVEGDLTRVRELAVEATSLGRSLGDTDLEMTALALEGLALVAAGNRPEGMPRLDEATTAAMSGEMTNPVAVGLSCCYLVMGCEKIRDFGRAAEWCHRLKEFCERMQFVFLLAECRAQYAGVLVWRGSWQEAEEELEAVRRFAVTRPPMWQAASIRLADLRRRQGKLEEAATLLKEVGEGHPLAILYSATIALDRSEPATAAHLVQRFLRRSPVTNQTDRVAGLEVLWRAQLAQGLRADAESTIRELQGIAKNVATEPVKASVLVAEGLLAASDGDHARARDAIEDALVLLAQSGGSFDLARARVELARVLIVMGHREAARAQLRDALAAFEQLGNEHAAAGVRQLLNEIGSSRHERGSLGRLTTRELEVLRLIAQGLSNQQVAKRLVVSEFTIKRHVANLLTKLGLPSRAAAAAHAVREGLI